MFDEEKSLESENDNQEINQEVEEGVLSEDNSGFEIDPLLILEKEKEELKEAYLRLSAETDNYRKRIQQEKENFKKLALKELLEKLLPVIDNLERSIKASENSQNIDSLQEGISLVLDQFEDILKDIGMEKIQISYGDEFDPQISEAVMIEERDDLEYPMTVVDVFETGRKLAGQVIRTAKVKVAKKNKK